MLTLAVSKGHVASLQSKKREDPCKKHPKVKIINRLSREVFLSGFCAISDLIHVEGAYAFSLRWFVDRILISSLKDIPSNDFKVDESNSAKNMDGIVAPLTHTLYRHISRTLLSKDRLLFALLLAVRPLLDTGAIGSAEWQFLLTGTACLQRAEGLVASALKRDATASPPDISPAPQRVEEHENPAKSWLPDSQWTEMCSLFGVSKRA